MRTVLLLLFVFPLALFAQQESLAQPKELVLEQKIYFASGSSELNEQALESLHKLLRCYKDSSLVELQLQAFTDDIGSAKQNEALALKRSEAVQAFFLEKGIMRSMIKTIASQQLKLNPNEDAQKQRQEHRIVNVELWQTSFQVVPKDKALNDFFANKRAAAKQSFSFSAEKGALIEGKEGTLLQIPPNSFVNENNEIITGTIEFSLIEAYRFGDMLAQNLSTQAGGQMLETGGMIYLEASDENGTALQLKEGAFIAASMASEEALLPGMEAWEAIEDSVGNIDWVATGQPATSAANGLLLAEDYRKNIYYGNSNIQKYFDQLEGRPIWKYKIGRAKQRPTFNKQQPQAPKLKTLDVPAKDQIATNMKKRRNESDREFKARIRSKYQVQQKKYRKQRYANQSKYRAFRRDSAYYERSLARYDRAMAKYLAYNEHMKYCLKEMHEHTENFDILDYQTAYDSIAKFFDMAEVNNDLMLGTVNSLIYTVENYIKDGYEMEDLWNRMQATSFEKMNAADCKKLKDTWASNYIKFNSKRFYKYRKQNNERLQKRLDKHANQIANLYHGSSTDVELCAKDLRKVRTWDKRLKKHYNYWWLNRVVENGKRYFDKRKELIDEFVAMETTTEQLQKALLERKNELGLVQLERIAAAVNEVKGENSRATEAFRNTEMAVMNGSSVLFRQLGWLNLDKVIPPFRQIAQGISNVIINTASVRIKNRRDKLEKRTVEFELNAEEKDNTAVFVLLKNQKTLIRAKRTENGTYSAGRQFKNTPVKVVALRIQGKDSELFVVEGAVSELNGTKVAYHKKSMDEIEALLASMQ